MERSKWQVMTCNGDYNGAHDSDYNDDHDDDYNNDAHCDDNEGDIMIMMMVIFCMILS